MSRWNLTEDWGFRLGSWARQIMVDAIDDSLPALKNDLPGRTPWRVRAHHDETTLVLVWEAGDPSSVNAFGALDKNEFSIIKKAASDKRSYRQLREEPTLAQYLRSTLLSLDRFDARRWGRPTGIAAAADRLVNDEPLAIAELLNADRVRRALPEPPKYALEAITNACWIVESQSACAQGTAFQLESIGFVTCEHVLHDETGMLFPDVELFHATKPSARFAVRDVVANRALDVAIFQANGCDHGALKVSSTTDVLLQAHVAVCGFPNYRLGDTCTLSPGVVVAHRMARGGIRRLLTNAGIVAGMSGGPALGRADEVIGVCVTGAPWMQATRETEDQSIIPISALQLLISPPNLTDAFSRSTTVSDLRVSDLKAGD